MRIAIVADVHGDAAALRNALNAAASTGYEALVSVGDLVDYKNPPPGEPRLLRSAIDWDPVLSSQLANALLVRGNQEDRTASYLHGTDVPDQVQRVLQAPLTLTRWGVTFTHGHRLPGEMVDPDRWVPLHATFDTAALIHGHHHRSSVVRLGNTRSWSETEDLHLRSGNPVLLSPGEKYLINVGATQGPHPSWGLLDTASNTYTPYFTQIRHRKDKS